MQVVVVGGGIVGLSAAWFLLKAGADVTVLTDREAGEGASAVNAGWVAPSLSGPVPAPGILSGSLRWMLRTMTRYDERRADGLTFAEHRTGLVMAYRNAKDADHEIAESGWLARFGL